MMRKYYEKMFNEAELGQNEAGRKYGQIREWRYTKNICAQISFDGVTNQKFMHEKNAA